MAHEIIWTNEASSDLLSIADYLLENWSKQTADNFIYQTISKIEKLAVMPSQGRLTSSGIYFMYKLE